MGASPNARGRAGVKSADTTEFMPRYRIDEDVQHAIDTAGQMDTNLPADPERFT